MVGEIDVFLVLVIVHGAKAAGADQVAVECGGKSDNHEKMIRNLKVP